MTRTDDMAERAARGVGKPKPKVKPFYALTTFDLEHGDLYWTGRTRNRVPVATKLLRRAALFTAGSLAWEAASRSGDPECLCTWDCKRVIG